MNKFKGPISFIENTAVLLFFFFLNAIFQFCEHYKQCSICHPCNGVFEEISETDISRDRLQGKEYCDILWEINKDNKLKEKPEAPTLTVRSASVCERSLQINIKLVIFIL